MNALRAELLKAVTTRLLLWFGLGLLASASARPSARRLPSAAWRRSLPF
jgi:hypothetical protein